MSVPVIPQRAETVALEEHTADSRWQFCMCASCQDIRRRIEEAPGKPIDFATYRHKDEKY